MWFKTNKKEKAESVIREVEKVKIQTVKCLKYKPEVKVKVGSTKVHLKFEDGREFTTTVYGSVYQYVTSEGLGYKGDEYKDAAIHKTHITNSEKAAENFIISCYAGPVQYYHNSNGGYVHQQNANTPYVNDPKNPTESIHGKVISAKIGKTDPNSEVDFKEGYLVEELKVLE